MSGQVIPTCEDLVTQSANSASPISALTIVAPEANLTTLSPNIGQNLVTLGVGNVGNWGMS